MSENPKVLVELSEVENAICMSCGRSVIGICPLRGNEPNNPEKTVCPTIKALRGLTRYTQP